MKKKLLYIRIFLTITGLLVFYTFVHEFAYRQYKDTLPADRDTLPSQPSESFKYDESFLSNRD